MSGLKLVNIIIFTVLILISNISHTQNLVVASVENRVIWVESISSANVKKQSIVKRILDLITGDNTHNYKIQPVSVTGVGGNDLMLLDQRHRIVWNYNRAKGSLINPIRSNDDFPSLVGICELDDNSIAFTDSFLNKIFILSPKHILSTFNSDSIQLEQPTGIAQSPLTGELWVVETAAHRITVFDKFGKVVKRIGSRGDGPSEFNYPTFIWIDNEGTIYIVDSLNFRIQILDENGTYISDFGEPGDASGYFARPKGIATDTFGNIYVVDALFNTVQIFDKSGTFLFNFGHQGKTDSLLWMPTGIYVDANNLIYVADTYNSRIQVYQLIDNK